MPNGTFTMFKDKLPTLKASVDYKTPSGSCETLRFCDSFLSVGGSVENCERITQTLRNELNPKPSGTIDSRL